jgi:replication-associated recombination protein RarA
MSRQTPYDVNRPTHLSEIIGNRSIVQRARRRLSTSSQPSRWLFSGPVGCGKTTMARITGHMLLCSEWKPEDSEPCGECFACVAGYYVEYDCSKLTDLVHFKSYCYPSTPVGPVVVAFDELQNLQPKLQRQLRKVVEECEHTLVFATTNPKALDDSLYGGLRAFEYAMKRPKPDEIANHLQIEFGRLGLTFASRSQLIRIADQYQCELRPCCEFPRKLFCETDGHLTDGYLEEIFPAAMSW